MSDNLNLVSRKARSRLAGRVCAVALISGAGVLVTSELSAQVSLQPSWIHRGAKVLAQIAANTTTPVSNSTLNTTSVPGSSCASNPATVTVNAALASFKDPNGNTVSEQVDCSQPFYQTTVTVTGTLSYNEVYYSFQTIPANPTTPASPAHGHATYFPLNANGPASLMFEPD
jgi:hypothetical protein